MTPEQFEAKWGEALRAAGIECEIAFVLGDCCVMLDGFFFHLGDKAEWVARGILVRMASDRGGYPVRIAPVGRPVRWMFVGAGQSSPDWHLDYDAALVAGCIALAGAERSKG